MVESLQGEAIHSVMQEQPEAVPGSLIVSRQGRALRAEPARFSLARNIPTGSLVGWGRRFRAEPGGVLEDALRAGVMDELFAADQALFHRHLAPGAEAVGEVGEGCIRGCHHERHCLRGPGTLSTDRNELVWIQLNNFLSGALARKNNRGIVQMRFSSFTCATLSQKGKHPL